MDIGNLVGMVFVDLKKAFDTIYDHILCRKLESYGVLHRKLTWFGSYLSKRVQCCRVIGFDLQIANIDIGVPHALVHSIFLFILMIYQE